MSSPEELYKFLLDIGIPRYIAEAFRKVPREKFVHESAKFYSYQDRALLSYEEGKIYSTSSQPSLMAEFMMEAGLRKGSRVLEIGGGTGYNAAVMAEVVGEDGLVVTMENQKGVCERAREILKGFPYKNIIYLCKDGYDGALEFAPFNAIIVTVAVDNLPPSWFEQLEDFGRIVVPLDLVSVSFYQPTFVFKRKGDMFLGRMRFITSFIKASGRLGERKERVRKIYSGVDCDRPGKVYMDRSSLGVLEVLTESVSTMRGNYIYADSRCSARYGWGYWKFCGSCEKLLRVIEMLDREGFPSLDSVYLGFDRDRENFTVSREGY